MNIDRYREMTPQMQAVADELIQLRAGQDRLEKAVAALQKLLLALGVSEAELDKAIADAP